MRSGNLLWGEREDSRAIIMFLAMLARNIVRGFHCMIPRVLVLMKRTIVYIVLRRWLRRPQGGAVVSRK